MTCLRHVQQPQGDLSKYNGNIFEPQANIASRDSWVIRPDDAGPLILTVRPSELRMVRVVTLFSSFLQDANIEWTRMEEVVNVEDNFKRSR